MLVALLEAVQKNPKLNSFQLIARWHGTEQGRLLKALAEKEWLIEGDNLEQQFFSTPLLAYPPANASETWNNFCEKARQSELTSEEKKTNCATYSAAMFAHQTRPQLAREVTAQV
nr:hypothetical protein GCM10020185_41190 [Pseudomonas brassicacearum subsp. brassicacearum]